jgi:hypothetical protein
LLEICDASRSLDRDLAETTPSPNAKRCVGWCVCAFVRALASKPNPVTAVLFIPVFPTTSKWQYFMITIMCFAATRGEEQHQQQQQQAEVERGSQSARVCGGLARTSLQQGQTKTCRFSRGNNRTNRTTKECTAAATGARGVHPTACG